MSLRARAMSGELAACVHGIGYIGSSTAAFLRARGIDVVGVDPDETKVVAARAGTCPVPALGPWLAAAGAPFRAFRASPSLSGVPPIPALVHHVCVPTEAEGAASDAALHECVDGIATREADATVIIESTVSPPYLDEIDARHPRLHIAVAPRRDWFDAPDKSLRTLPRIVGTDEPDVLADVVDYLRLVCDDVRAVADARVAALTKIVENGMRQVEIAYANELALHLSDRYDVRRILELAATKWNVGLFRPSVGVGGYCIPLAPRYLQLLDRPLTLSSAAMAASADHIARVIDFLARRRSVDFWGASYKAGAPFTASSSVAAWIASALCERGVPVRLFALDGHEEAWARGAGMPLARWPEDAGGDALVIPVAHAAVLGLNDAAARATVGRYGLALDNEDALRRISGGVWEASGTHIVVPGTIGWLEA